MSTTSSTSGASPTPTLEYIGRLAIADYHATEAYMADCEDDAKPMSDTTSIDLYNRMSVVAEALRLAIETYEKEAKP